MAIDSIVVHEPIVLIHRQILITSKSHRKPHHLSSPSRKMDGFFDEFSQSIRGTKIQDKKDVIAETIVIAKRWIQRSKFGGRLIPEH